jgi:hypothetical protein
MGIVIHGIELNLLNHLKDSAIREIPQKRGSRVRGLGVGRGQKNGQE